jgi:hypothetical protein
MKAGWRNAQVYGENPFAPALANDKGKMTKAIVMAKTCSAAGL